VSTIAGLAPNADGGAGATTITGAGGADAVSSCAASAIRTGSPSCAIRARTSAASSPSSSSAMPLRRSFATRQGSSAMAASSRFR
jgi:hypothetical protein